MTFVLSQSQLAELRNIFYNTVSSPVQYPVAAFYRALADMAQGQEGVDPASVLWLRGAAEVNAKDGSRSDYIRGYNTLQYEARNGEGAVPEGYASLEGAMDQASFNIGQAIFLQVVGVDSASPGTAQVPPLNILAEQDAGPTAQILFGGDARSC